jgi:hypothetical protein
MEIMFAVASLMLVGAVIIFALPTAVEAAKKTQWCTIEVIDGNPNCFNAKGQCEKFLRDHPVGWTPCREQPS